MSKTLTSVLLISAAVAVNVFPGIGNAISAAIFSGFGASATAAAISVYSTYALTTGLTLAGIGAAASVAGLGPSMPKPETAETATKPAALPPVLFPMAEAISALGDAKARPGRDDLFDPVRFGRTY